MVVTIIAVSVLNFLLITFNVSVYMGMMCFLSKLLTKI